ncbi:MAG: biopolymer transporter ExbD [Spirulinaceae cyanobacterium SM2_1_0]|nr:biopolymer transporter ExbD [Spirulinaceae cyanobacterium SM2_1_0]
MGLKTRPAGSQVPEVNLVPMMDVLMSVLTFFIITSMTFTGEQVPNVSLPETGEQGAGSFEPIQEDIEQLTVGLNADSEIIVQGQVADELRLNEVMREFLDEHPEGIVVLKADRELDYFEISQLLQTMGRIGGDRVSLAIQHFEAGE